MPINLALRAFIAVCIPLAANAAASVDCPERDARYSIDSPLMDILLKPAARVVVEREAPALLPSIPARFAQTTVPSFSAIISLRSASSSWHTLTAEELARLDHALAQLPVTAADKVARCARYDTDKPRFELSNRKPRFLVFEKMTGFRDGPSVEAARTALGAIAERNGWGIAITDKGGAMDPAALRQFDAVIWNNVSGDVLTVTQRRAFQSYVEGGGGFFAVHGSAGDPIYFWDWYVDTLIGARFEGHPMAPQFQEARIAAEPGNPFAQSLPSSWQMTDEWYSFKTNPRASGAHIVATLDESTYSPQGPGGVDLHMGDHPIAWIKCVGKGRSFYSAIGHRPEGYADPNYVKLLEAGMRWAAKADRAPLICK